MVAKTDLQIQKDVLLELQLDPRIDEAGVGVQVHNGIVTLTGEVSSYAKKIAATEAAHLVEGVLDVANDMVIHLPYIGDPNDTEIAAAVRNALIWNDLVDEKHISTTVASGNVTLQGTVPSIRQKQDVVRAVHNIRGVRGIVNNIAVTPTVINASEAKHTIETALHRRAGRVAKGIQIEVKDRKVILNGQVSSWSDKQVIMDTASYLPGVLIVEDHLKIGVL